MLRVLLVIISNFSKCQTIALFVREVLVGSTSGLEDLKPWSCDVVRHRAKEGNKEKRLDFMSIDDSMQYGQRLQLADVLCISV